MYPAIKKPCLQKRSYNLVIEKRVCRILKLLDHLLRQPPHVTEESIRVQNEEVTRLWTHKDLVQSPPESWNP